MGRKLIATMLLVLAILTVWWRGIERPDYAGSEVGLTAVAPPKATGGNRIAVTGLWRLESRQSMFGGFSAMVARDDGGLRLFGDYGYVLDLPRAKAGDSLIQAPLRRVGADSMTKSARDIESATTDGDAIWLGLESRNAIVRYDRNMREQRRAAPEAMAGWGNNSGPEALAKLSDGRFLVLREGWPWWFVDRPIEGVLFDSDPTEGAAGETVEITGNGFYRPVDMAGTPDGRLLVLLRRMRPGLRIGYDSRLALLDPADLADGRARLVSTIDLDGLLPEDNYEGMVLHKAAGRWTLWLVSDDNGSHFQASWLARLSIDPAAF